MESSTNPRRQDELNKVAEQAAEWLVTLEEATPEQQAQFFRWISESPLHVEAFLRAKAIDTLAARVDPNKEIEIVATDAAIADLTPDDAGHRSSPPTRPPRRRFAFAVAASVALACLSAAAWMWHASKNAWTTYRT